MDVKTLSAAVERAAAHARERNANNPRMQVVAYFGVRTFVEAAAVGIIRSRPPEPGFDPRSILGHMSEILFRFEAYLLDHFDRNAREYKAHPQCFHGPVIEAHELLVRTLGQVAMFNILGHGKDGYDVDAVFQNAGVHLRDRAHEMAGPKRCEKCAQCQDCFEDQSARSMGSTERHSPKNPS